MVYEPGDDLDWIRSVENQYLGKNRGEYFLVKDRSVRGIFKSRDVALSEGNKAFGEDNYIVYHMFLDPFADLVSKKNAELLAELI